MPYRKYTPVPRGEACGEVDKSREALAQEILDNWKYDLRAEQRLTRVIQVELLLLTIGMGIALIWWLS